MNTMTRITNTPRDYAWGTPGGISRLFGQAPTEALEAELWLGSHPASPSRAVDREAGWSDLHEWEKLNGRPLPFLLKVLSAAAPLSLQAHPTPDQARQGFAREEEDGLARDNPERSYKDPYAKPEIIVAVEDGFEALCGFREPAGILAILDQLADLGGSTDFADLRSRLTGPDPLREATSWALSDDSGAAAQLTSKIALTSAANRGRFELLARIADEYPGDPGLLVALMTNHVVLRKGEALWLPAGNIHAYLRGTGIELMGPSDNVVRGGLTPKRVDVTELMKVVDFRPIRSPRLRPEPVGINSVSYRPSTQASGQGVEFQLLKVEGDTAVQLTATAIALVVDGSFRLSVGGFSQAVGPGEAVFLDARGVLQVAGRGELYIALGTRMHLKPVLG
jgi:mannose-6-phosphate isomerase